jgi:hypothetical protein
MLRRRTWIAVALFLDGKQPQAQQTAARPVPMRPPLFFREVWKSLPTPPDDHNAWPATQGGVSTPNLELSLYGTSGKEIQLVAGRAQSDVVPHNLWTGTTTSPSAAALRDRNNFVDQPRRRRFGGGPPPASPGLAIAAADGTWLVATAADFRPTSTRASSRRPIFAGSSSISRAS